MNRMLVKLLWIIAAGIAGGIVFIVAQHLEGFQTDIAEFMGAEIARRGGYEESLAGVVGWAVHFGVALSYAALYGLITLARWFSRPRPVRWAAAAGLAVVLGWLTTLITAPAITVTTSVLAGDGFPNSLPGLNTAFGAAFWNHILFFAVCLALTVIVPDLLNGRPRGSATGAEVVP